MWNQWNTFCIAKYKFLNAAKMKADGVSKNRRDDLILLLGLEKYFHRCALVC